MQRFDANSYLYLSKALDYFDLSEDTDLVGAFKDIKTKFLIITFTSDCGNFSPVQGHRQSNTLLLAKGTNPDQGERRL